MTKEVKKVLIIPPQFFPIPAVKGGAVENLITNLITENEIHSDVFFYVISRFNEEAAKYSYKNSKIFYLDNKSSSASFKLRHFLRKIIFNRFTKKVFRNSKFGFNELTYFAYRCDKIAKKIKPDIIVSESYDQVHRLWPLVKRFGNENFYYHLHYVRENEPNTRKLVPNTIAISEYVLNHWVNNDQIKGRELVLYNGIDLDAFEHKSDDNNSFELRNSLGIDNNDFVVLFVGRLRPHKGVLELLKAFSLIGDKKIKLLLAGDFLSESKEHKGLDESKFEQDCLSLINANKNIIRVGNISYDKIPDYYSISDVQCIPSIWEEGAGLVAIEGMASGLPLIITDSGGMPEYTGNECAIIVKRDSDLEKNIASSIELLKNNSDMCGRMSQIGKERARQFSKQNYYRNYIDFLLKKEKKQMNNPCFSIICPVYNAQKYLKNAVESVFKQSYEKWELILIDDGSTDGSGSLCDSFASKDKRIKVIHQSNQGQSVARLKGLETCSGDYVLFLDSDDQYEPNALELLASELNSNGADAILYNAKKKSTKECVDVYVLDEKAILRDKNSILKECFANRTAGYFWTYCFKRNLFELSSEAKEKFSRIKYSEDVYLIYQIISQNAESLIILPESLYIYNINDDSITHTQTAVKVKDRFNVFDEVYSDLFKNYGIYPIKSIKANIGWTYLSFLNRAAKEYDYPVFREECLKIRESFIYKKLNSFKKDRFNFLIHFLFRIRMYKKAYSIIRKH